MCAQVADHSRFMDALGELHAKGHSPRDSQQVQSFNYARKRSGIHRLREPDIDDDDDDDKWIARFRDNSHRWFSSSNEAAPAGQRVGRDWSGVSAFVLCENT